MANTNRKATREEMARIAQTINAAYPSYEVVFGGHIGRIAPRVRTISFRLRDQNGKFRSNPVWLMPDDLASLTPGNIRWLVERANGNV